MENFVATDKQKTDFEKQITLFNVKIGEKGLKAKYEESLKKFTENPSLGTEYIAEKKKLY